MSNVSSEISELGGASKLQERSKKPATESEPYFLADHPVLDLLNTVTLLDGAISDFWQSDADVMRWLVRLGAMTNTPSGVFPKDSLLLTARNLREIVRTLVTKRKDGLQGNPAALNKFLAKCPSSTVLLWEAPLRLHIGTLRRQDTPEEFLAPLAEAAAEFLVESDFDLVRICEHEECVLWFYDRTKSHKRRWCSMAVCGNRHKVAAYRKRSKQ